MCIGRLERAKTRSCFAERGRGECDVGSLGGDVLRDGAGRSRGGLRRAGCRVRGEKRARERERERGNCGVFPLKALRVIVSRDARDRLEAGYRVIDTASHYENERDVGEGVRLAVDRGFLRR